jgi:hypothetical protein
MCRPLRRLRYERQRHSIALRHCADFSTGGVLFGYDTGTIGGILAMPYWLKTFSTGYTVDGLPAITSSQSSQIVSILVSCIQIFTVLS